MNEIVMKGHITIGGIQELKKQVELDVQKYNNLVVTSADEASKARNTRSMLNTFRTAVDSERKRINKDIKASVDEILEIIDKPIRHLDEQIKIQDEKEQAETRAEIEEYFMTLDSLVELDRLWNPKWLLKSSSMKAAKEELESKVNKINDEFKLLDLFGVADIEALRKEYLKVLDVAQAKNAYEAKQAVSQPVTPTTGPTPMFDPLEAPQDAPEQHSVVLKAIMSTNALYRLEAWMTSMKIAYTIEKK